MDFYTDVSLDKAKKLSWVFTGIPERKICHFNSLKALPTKEGDRLLADTQGSEKYILENIA